MISAPARTRNRSIFSAHSRGSGNLAGPQNWVPAFAGTSGVRSALHIRGPWSRIIQQPTHFGLDTRSEYGLFSAHSRKRESSWASELGSRLRGDERSLIF